MPIVFGVACAKHQHVGACPLEPVDGLQHGHVVLVGPELVWQKKIPAPETVLLLDGFHCWLNRGSTVARLRDEPEHPAARLLRLRGDAHEILVRVVAAENHQIALRDDRLLRTGLLRRIQARKELWKVQVLEVGYPGDDAERHPSLADEPHVRENVDAVGLQQRLEQWHDTERAVEHLVNKPGNGAALKQLRPHDRRVRRELILDGIRHVAREEHVRLHGTVVDLRKRVQQVLDVVQPARVLERCIEPESYFDHVVLNQSE